MENSECKAKTLEENKERVNSDGHQEEIQALTKRLAELQPRQAPKVFVGRNANQSGNTDNFSRSLSHVKCYFNCGNQYNQGKCPAQNQTCRKCGKANHCERVCRNNTSRFTPRFTRQSYGSQPLNHVDMTTSPQECNFMSHNNPGHAVHKVSAVGQERLSVFRQYLKIEERQIQYLIDTGSSTNILNYRTFTLLQKHRQFQ